MSELIWLLLAAPPGLMSLWIMICALVGSGRARRLDQESPWLRLAVLIPAHDEEHTIAGCVRSILRSRYPRDRFDVYVVADNCRDATAERAAAAGARVVIRDEPSRRGKGYALNFLAAHLRELPGYDGWVFFDADSHVDRHCLAWLARELSAGASCVQGFYGCRRARLKGSALPVLAARLFNGSRPAGRSRLGFSAGLRGNGMALRPEVHAGSPWRDEALLEDWELALDLAERGIAVRFCREARVFAKSAPSRRAATEQRWRWEGARPRLIQDRLPWLLKNGLAKRNRLALESALDLVTPPLSILAASNALIFTLATLSGAVSAACLAGAGLLSLSMSVLLADRFDRPSVLRSALSQLPSFLLWKLSFYTRVLKASRGGPVPPTSWVRTERRAGEPDERREPVLVSREEEPS
ncbi:MAG: glycosyltransferase family 2 protein [Planctomycetota bacterium]